MSAGVDKFEKDICPQVDWPIRAGVRREAGPWDPGV